MSPQTEVVYRKTVARADRRGRLTSYGTGYRQQVGLTREQIRRPLQDVDGLLLGQPSLRKEMFPHVIEVWYPMPVAIIGEKLLVLGSVGGWMWYILDSAFRVVEFVLE